MHGGIRLTQALDIRGTSLNGNASYDIRLETEGAGVGRYRWYCSWIPYMYGDGMITQDDFDALAARVASMETALGSDYKNARLSFDEWVKRGRPTELPDGDYPLFYWNRQLAISVADYATDLTADRTSLASARADIDALTKQVAALPQDNTPAQTNVVFPIRSREGAGVRFITDTDGKQAQRPPGTNYQQVYEVGGSEDGGGGIGMNVIYPGGGQRAYMPDPTRYGLAWHQDSQGMMSVNICVAGEEFEPGKFAVTAPHKGQLVVFIPDLNGDMTIRLPQGGDLYIERGDGRMGANPQGHFQTVSRQKVLTDGVNVPAARGGLRG